MQQHDMTKWAFRIMVVLGAIGFGTLYTIRHDWSQGWMPTLSDEYRPPAAEGASSVAPIAAPAFATGEFPRCQPIGRTAKGELVYSMDCEIAAGK